MSWVSVGYRLGIGWASVSVSVWALQIDDFAILVATTLLQVSGFPQHRVTSSGPAKKVTGQAPT